MNRRTFLKFGLLTSGFAFFGKFSPTVSHAANFIDEKDRKLPFKKIVKTDEEWKRVLTKEQYEVTRKAATETPYTSPLLNVHDKGFFSCVCCDLPVFSSKTKFDSQTGWVSFYAPINKINVREAVDKTLAEIRTEVLCNRCDAHLGHVFDDGPKPTGLRYCINGIALKFVKT